MTNKHKNTKAAVSFALAIAATFGMATYAFSQATDAAIKTYSDWTVSCAGIEPDQNCAMAQRLSIGESGVQMRLEIVAGPNGTASGILITPFGLDITKGVSINVDGGQRFNLPFRTCRQFGCVVSLNLGADVVALLQRGTVLNATLYQLDGASALGIPFSLTGFSAAFADIVSR